MFLSKQSLIIIFIALITSIFFRVKIIEELPLGTDTNHYGLKGFDDEPAHLNYVKFIIENNEFPVLKSKITDPDAFEKFEFEYHQPFFYYGYTSFLFKFLDLKQTNLLKLGRYFNFIIFLFSVLILYLIFKEIGFNQIQVTCGLVFYLMLGSSVYYGSLLSNDMLSWYLIWQIIYLLLKNPHRNWIYLIVSITLLHFTKFNVVLIYPALVYLVLKNRNHVTSYRTNLILILPILFSLPIYSRNLSLYGNPFPIGNITGETWYYVSNIWESLFRLKKMFYTFFFSMYFEPAKKLIYIFNYITYIWLIITLFYWIKNIKFEIRENQFINLLLVTNILAFLYFAIPTGIIEGRQLFPALPFIIYFMVLGLCQFLLKLKINEKYAPVIIYIIFLPSFIIGFYL
ncbi:hypothetical protein OAQ99_06670 [Candidatus Kapabacteria bacterium]|nr:hypothetical protein [Candidatus Kapabacteria bacterium]